MMSQSKCSGFSQLTRSLAGIPMSPAILFLNSNKSEHNLQKIIRDKRQKCRLCGVELLHECIVNKGADRDIDRDAINQLISLLLTGKYEVIVVEKMTDLTDDLSDLNEFIKDAAAIGVYFFELSTMLFHYYEPPENNHENNSYHQSFQ